MRRFLPLGVIALAIFALPSRVVAQDAPPKARPERPNPEAMFKTLDRDGNGQLSLDEFKQGMKRLHARQDRGERPAMRDGQRDVRRPGPPRDGRPVGPPQFARRMGGPGPGGWAYGPPRAGWRGGPPQGWHRGGPPQFGRHHGPWPQAERGGGGPWMHGYGGPCMHGYGGPRPAPWMRGPAGPPRQGYRGGPPQGQMPHEALARAAEWYKKADKNQDGKIDVSEVPEPRREGFKKVLARADKDGDKAISRDEAKQMFRAMAKKRMEAPRRGPGLRAGGGPPEAVRERVKVVVERFKTADKNQDGKLSREEAPGRLKEHFSRIDADADGQITPAEIRKAAIERVKQRGPDLDKKAVKPHGDKSKARAKPDRPPKKDVSKDDGPPKP